MIGGTAATGDANQDERKHQGERCLPYELLHGYLLIAGRNCVAMERPFGRVRGAQCTDGIALKYGDGLLTRLVKLLLLLFGGNGVQHLAQR